MSQGSRMNKRYLPFISKVGTYWKRHEKEEYQKIPHDGGRNFQVADDEYFDLLDCYEDSM